MTFLPVLAAGGTSNMLATTVLPLVLMFGLFYFLLIRPQKKQEREHAALVNSVETGDSILTSAGFYGVVIDVMPEIVIVEFGNNKNCRIPMKREHIQAVEKANKDA
ncbi:preprotein translocase subunit YajC [[Clostridium] polysaccharolyticum]|jgi:preprotein translocase subunit YajC|uniref:Preprotein translocase subunit YajC n=1 Tax=[Clostridium] polysaccharolyticum TaxID=29364 RepID=A0A1I0DNU4_9FIRM|nr:preprotein translocase subunit YajC [[Clostridium] polysaccharolyticum]SET33384.1 preprotein translocase subunit YajC [[Clostridium] polysaccharolyticum]